MPLAAQGKATPRRADPGLSVTLSTLGGPAGTCIIGYGFSALQAYDDSSGPGLCVGGPFTTAGALRSSNIAVWRCIPGAIFIEDLEAGSTAAWALAMA